MASIDEYKKFVSSMPEAQREFRTIELFHPDFGLLRFVQDFKSVNLTLESTAPRNASTSVTFTAISMSLTEPGENGQIEQVLSVNLGAVGNEVNDKLEQITGAGSLTPIELIYRKYYSGDLSEPVLVLSMSVADVSFKSYEAVTFTGEDSNFAIKRAGQLYLLERFPTLSLV
jgi:hypothetical protein